MRIRHKQPTLVSMWMLDVFCCALGCVTLLFLLNSRMATDEAKANKTALIDLRTTEKKLAATLNELDQLKLRLNDETAGSKKLAAALSEAEGFMLKLTEERDLLAKNLATTRNEADSLAKKLATAQSDVKATKALLDATQTALNAAEAKIDANAKELALARTQVNDVDEILRKKQKESDALAKKLSETAAAADDLQRLMKKKDDERLLLVKQAADLQKMLDDLDAKLVASRKELTDTNAALKAAAADLATLKKTTADGDAANRAMMKDLQKKIDDANVTIIDLQGEKAKLADKFDRMQKETENRFAGIAMTGKRVVFLVDMSGSMSKRDVNTGDDSKWPLVVETVARVARSIPTLEKYQVVVFSSSARWVFGNGEWQDYTGEKSAEAIKAALLKVVPQDDTNIHAGMELAFKRRADGLDGIYFFSDGLPTSGPGLSVAQQTATPPLTESQKSEILGKHIRKILQEEWNRASGGKPPVRINAIGFYFESPDVGAFLWALARENEGSFVGMSKP